MVLRYEGWHSQVNSRDEVKEFHGAAAAQDSLEELEIKLLVEGIYEYYGYDFRHYALGTLSRKIVARMQKEGLLSVSGLLEKVLHDSGCMSRLVSDLSITVSAMFRDPGFFATFRSEVVPLLRTYPFVRIWHAGCGKGEEVYSLAIVLHEEGLYDRCRIYATDMNPDAVKQAQSGVFPIEPMQEYTGNYIAAGGTGSFSEYYTARYEHVILRPWLKSNLVFSTHNLATDGPFNEFHAIVCRNVMIYFNRSLQARAHDLFYNSLIMFGFLGLGRQESIKFSPRESCYEAVNGRDKIYRKVG